MAKEEFIEQHEAAQAEYLAANPDAESLARRVEAEPPSRELDALVHEALLGAVVEHSTAQWHDADETPFYTTDIGAAALAVPEDCVWEWSGTANKATVWLKPEAYPGGYERLGVGAGSWASKAITAAALRSLTSYGSKRMTTPSSNVGADASHKSVPETVQALAVAVATIDAFYQWIDMIEEAGGATSLSGISKCNAFIASMKKNRSRVEQLVMEPARKAFDEATQ